MGSPYTDLVTFPVFTDPAWKDRYEDLLASRLANSPATQPTSYYFSQSGNDTTGDGSQALPWKTESKARSTFDGLATNARTALLFNRGDVWKEAYQLNLQNKNYVVVGDYGSAAAPPTFSNWTLSYNGSGWTQAGATARYTRTEATEPGGIRLVANPYGYVFYKASSITEVESVNRSWFWSANTLHINMGAGWPTSAFGGNPNNYNLEACPKNGNYGLQMTNCDFSRVRNLRIDGYGLTLSETGVYGLRLEYDGNREMVCENVEVYFAGNHAIGQLAPAGSTTGGEVTFLRCRAGLISAQSGGGTTWVTYGTGKMETIWHQCMCRAGCVPDSGWYTPATPNRNGGSFFSHTDGTDSHRLLISFGCVAEEHEFGCSAPTFIDNAMAAATIDLARCFIVGERALGWQPFTEVRAGQPNVVMDDCHYQVRNQGSVTTWTGNTLGGWLLNSVFEFDLVNNGQNASALCFTAQPHAPQVWHSEIYFFNSPAGAAYLNMGAAPATYVPNATFFNSIFCVEGPQSAGTANSAVNFVNAAASIGGNAYLVKQAAGTGTPSGYDNDPKAVTLASRWTGGEPDPTSALYRGGAVLPGGYVLGHGRGWRLRDTSVTPTVGASVADDDIAIPAKPTVSYSFPSPISLKVTISGSPGLTYTVYHRRPGDGGDVTDGSVTGSGSVTVAGLTANEHYIVTVVGSNGTARSLPFLIWVTQPAPEAPAVPSSPARVRSNRGGGFTYSPLDDSKPVVV